MQIAHDVLGKDDRHRSFIRGAPGPTSSEIMTVEACEPVPEHLPPTFKADVLRETESGKQINIHSGQPLLSGMSILTAKLVSIPRGVMVGHLGCSSGPSECDVTLPLTFFTVSLEFFRMA